ncbi:MAG TPA: ATP synthase F1 subunit delta [Acidobacteriaceae bacterium]|nr:ATP synthase F1 subunit delta [Acidobacteriaceae bacterium]
MAAVLSLRYARAFAEVAVAAHLDPMATQSQLRDFADTVAGSHELRELLENPSIEQADKLKVLDAIASRLGMYAQTRNFIAVIMEHGRIPKLNEIIEEYRQLADEQAGAVEARITSARPLSDVDRAQLESQVARLAGARVRASYFQDLALLGGAVVEVGSTIYDGSVRTQLEQLKQRLANA